MPLEESNRAVQRSRAAELVAWHRQIMTTKINELRKAAAAASAAAETLARARLQLIAIATG